MLRNVCSGAGHLGVGRKEVAAAAGAIEAVAAMAALPASVGVQETATLAVYNLCFGVDPAALERKRRAGAAGMVEAAEAALAAFPHSRVLSEWGPRLIVEDSSAAALRIARQHLERMRAPGGRIRRLSEVVSERSPSAAELSEEASAARGLARGGSGLSTLSGSSATPPPPAGFARGGSGSGSRRSLRDDD